VAVGSSGCKVGGANTEFMVNPRTAVGKVRAYGYVCDILAFLREAINMLLVSLRGAGRM